MSLVTSIDVPFGSQSGSGHNILKWERDSKRAPINEIFLRLVGKANRVIQTSGQIEWRGNGSQPYRENIFFSPTNGRVNLAYPHPSKVSIEPTGAALDGSGKSKAVLMSYDSSHNTVVCSPPAYAAARVEYNYGFKLYKFTFGPPGAKCPSSKPGESPFDPSVVVAFNDTELLQASINLDPPLCGDQTSLPEDVDAPNMVVEVAPLAQPRLSKDGDNTNLIRGQCFIDVYPDVVAKIKSTAGILKPPKSGYVKSVTDLISFNGTSYGSLKYPPRKIGVAYEPQGTFFDEFGETFTPSFASETDAIDEGEWENKNDFVFQRRRTVTANEIVVTDSFGRVKPCFGVVLVQYQTTFSRSEYWYEYDPSLKQFKPAVIYASFERRIGILLLNEISLSAV